MEKRYDIYFDKSSYYEDKTKGIRCIAENKTIPQAFDEIDKFLKERNYTSYYKRVYTVNGCTTVDVGSHHEFFRMYELKK